MTTTLTLGQLLAEVDEIIGSEIEWLRGEVEAGDEAVSVHANRLGVALRWLREARELDRTGWTVTS